LHKEEREESNREKGKRGGVGGMLFSDHNGSLLSWQPGGNLIE